MTSLQTTIKQIPLRLGYYVNVADMRTTFYQNNGTDAAPVITTNIYAQSTVLVSYNGTGTRLSTVFATAGAAVLRDHGKTLLSASRVFRKVQLLVSSNSLVNGGTDGVGGVSYETNTAVPYLTGYIELPGTGGYSTGTNSFTPVARLG
jgi:hypothetical protein